MASEFNADDILEVSTSGSISGLTSGPTSGSAYTSGLTSGSYHQYFDNFKRELFRKTFLTLASRLWN